MIITALIVLAAASSSSGTQTRGLVIPQPVRYEFIYQVAEKACPRANQLSPDVHRIVSFLDDITNRLGMTDDEEILLTNFCLMYAQGLREQ